LARLGTAQTPAPPARARGATPELRGRRRTARAGLQFNLSDLKARIPSGCGGKAVGLRHISHLGTWGNQRLCSEILQTFRKRLPSDLDVHFSYKDHSMAGVGTNPPAGVNRRDSDLGQPKTSQSRGFLMVRYGLGWERRVQVKEDFA